MNVTNRIICQQREYDRSVRTCMKDEANILILDYTIHQEFDRECREFLKEHGYSGMTGQNEFRGMKVYMVRGLSFQIGVFCTSEDGKMKGCVV